MYSADLKLEFLFSIFSSMSEFSIQINQIFFLVYFSNL